VTCDTRDSTETELAELGDMLSDIVSARPSRGVFASAAENCSTCVDAGDKAVMQDVVAKVALGLGFGCGIWGLCFGFAVVALFVRSALGAPTNRDTQQQVKAFCAHATDPQQQKVPSPCLPAHSDM